MTIILFAKFGAKKHLEMLRKEGLLYCNTISHFSNLKDNSNRGDKYESIIELQCLPDGIFELKLTEEQSDQWKKLKAENVQIQKSYEKTPGNLYCMSEFKLTPKIEPAIFCFNEKFIEFGSFVLIIFRPDLFRERLKNTLKSLKLKYSEGNVRYIDFKKYTGELSYFQKDVSFSWQEEYRIVLNTDKHEVDDHFKFSIGSIEDISVIYDISKKVKNLYYKLPIEHEFV